VLKSRVAFAAAMICMPGAAWAGAWTMPEDTGQILTTFTTSTATAGLEGSHGLVSIPRYSKDELSVLLEYGITDELTAILNPGLQHVDIAPPISAERTGLGYTEFGARYAFWQPQTWVFSGQATLRLPGTTDTSNPAAIGYTDVEADLRLLAGHNFQIAGLPSFFDVEVAERIRTAGYPSEFRVDGTLGVKIFPQWTLLAQSFNVISEGAGLNPLFGGSYDYFKFQLSALYAINHDWTLQGGLFTTYAGDNAIQENGIILGVWHRF
jgi:protein XagA